MFNSHRRIESQSSKKRYLYGKQMEDLIVKSLESEGLVFENVDSKTDCIDKIDRYMIVDGIKKPCQIKCRMSYSGDDILVDVFEPFFGIDSEQTKKGRDYIGQYEVYIVLARDGKTIRVIDGIVQKQVIEDILQEWKEHHYLLPEFNSYQYEGCQVKYTHDRSNKRPKVLMFINPEIYEVGTEIKLYNMKT